MRATLLLAFKSGVLVQVSKEPLTNEQMEEEFEKWFQAYLHLENALADPPTEIRYCENPGCGARLPPGHVAVYCSSACALEDM